MKREQGSLTPYSVAKIGTRARNAGRKRGETISEQLRQNRIWARGAGTNRDAAWFLREVVPKLDGNSLSQIAKATGLSLAACSRFRAGTRVPHPRHWEVFQQFVESTQ